MAVIKKGVLLCIFMLLLSLSAYARSFDAKAQTIDNTITFGQVASYNIVVRNDLETTERFNIKTLDFPFWDIKTEPVVNPIQLTIAPGEEKELKIYVTPMHVSNYGVYDVSLQIEQMNRKEKMQLPMRVNVVSPQAGTYVETVIATILMDDKIDPSKEIPISIGLNNQNIFEYPEVLVIIESNLIKDSIKESLQKKEKKTITLTKNIDPKTPPQEDTIIVKLISNNKTLHTDVKRIEIIESENIVKDSKKHGKFLKSIEDITITNKGNVEYEKALKVESSLMQMLFTSSAPKGKFVKEEGKRYLLVPLKISPGESQTVKVIKNYITLLIIAVLFGALVLVYYILRSPLVIRKKAANIAYKEGGVSELKVILSISNRGKSKLTNIEIIDKVPHIADLEKGITIGTLHPNKILRHDRKGTIIKWIVDELEAGDERVISYKIKSHLSILGEFSLSPTIGKILVNGKEVITHSNSLGVSP